MVLETPDRVKPGYTVLKNPSFSPMGVVLRIIPAARHFIPITSITLIYYRVNQEEVTLHLYLVPNDCTIQKVILRCPKCGARVGCQEMQDAATEPLVEILNWESECSSVRETLVCMIQPSSRPLTPESLTTALTSFYQTLHKLL
jgi:hypothetical protein